MRIALSWHNSEVSEVAWLPPAAGLERGDAAGSLRVVLAVASVQRTVLNAAGTGGRDADGEWGFIKGAVLTLTGARLPDEQASASSLGDYVGSVAQGQWCEDAPGAPRGLSTVPLPWLTPASGTLSLAFRNGSVLQVHARRASIALPPDAAFIESYAC